MVSQFERDALWRDACEQARIAGVDPNDPAFLKHAKEAPAGLSFYDQVTHAIVKTRAEHELEERREGTEDLLTISEVIEAARDIVR